MSVRGSKHLRLGRPFLVDAMRSIVAFWHTEILALLDLRSMLKSFHRHDRFSLEDLLRIFVSRSSLFCFRFPLYSLLGTSWRSLPLLGWVLRKSFQTIILFACLYLSTTSKVTLPTKRLKDSLTGGRGETQKVQGDSHELLPRPTIGYWGLR